MTSAQYARRFVHPDDMTLVGIETQKAIETTDPNFSRKLEHRITYADGETGYINVRFYIIKDAQGHTVKTYGANQDITERKLAEEKIHRHTNELAALLMISQELTATLNLQSILQLTTDRATELTEMKTSALYLLEGETLRLWATTPPLPPQFPEEFRHAPLADHPHIRKAITTGLPVFLHDTLIADLTPAERQVCEIRGLRSNLYVPLKTGTKVLGTFIISSILELKWFSEAEINLCNTLANLAALALVNAQLFESEQSYAVKLREQIAELVQTEEKLKKSEHRYRNLFNLANEGLILLTMDGEIAEVNQSFAQMHGYTVEEIRKINIRDLDVLGKDTFDERANIIDRILAGEVVRFEPEHYHKDGHRFSLSNTVSLITIENQPYFLAFHQDITGRKQAEQELVMAKVRAEQSDHLKSAFLANMSHEIRTPMNGILGFAELLKEPDLSGLEQQKFIRMIEKSGVRMLKIINDIVDISKIESGQMEVSMSETNVNDQIEFIYNFFIPEVERKNLQLSFKTSLPAKEAIIKSDREKIFAILTNLVKNAIKFTKEGSIEFGYNLVGSDHSLSLQFFVKDTGIGIPKNKQEAVFERFTQADVLNTEASQGAGLGLSISKAYVEILGGKIWVESEEGKGSAFYFTIPYR
jgi:PAS domain S-box-containing protein